MSPKNSGFAALSPIIVLLVSGCSVQTHVDADRSTLTSSPAASAQCTVVAEAPGLPAWEINEALPIKGVDVAHEQRELLVKAGGGDCSTGPAKAVLDECLPASGPNELVSDTRLWRDANEFVDQEITAGAVQILSEDMTGYTLEGETFHWRAVAIKYPNPPETRASPAWAAINACDELQDDYLQSGVVSLSQGNEPFLAAKINGSTLYIVETWITTDLGDVALLDDTETGLPPADAVRMIMAWFIDHADV